MKVGLIQLIQAEKHRAPMGHPENVHRMQFALEQLMVSDAAPNIEVLNPGAIDAEQAIGAVHDPRYLAFIKTASATEEVYLDSDTYLRKGSFEAALETASASVGAVDMILGGDWKRIFLAGRPPGHHAEYDRGMGFCLINNTAVAAERALQAHHLKRIAIVDWDVHHGNGTQHHFYDRSDIYFVSLHRFPFYPGSGASAERGNGAGAGYTLNFPMRQGTGDDEYVRAFEQQIIPELDKFAPEFVIITAGFDAHRDDPMGGMNVTEQGFGVMTRHLVELADRHAGGKILSLFEGGYSPSGNALALYRHIRELQAG